MKLFVAYANVESVGRADYFDKGVPVLLGKRRNYADIIARQPRSSVVAVVAESRPETGLMLASVSRLGFRRTVEIYGADPVELAGAIRAKHPDIVMVSISRTNPVIEHAYELTRDLFEPHSIGRMPA
ncbi:MAG: hypothetical protein HY516_02550 [Candidatus Aenigmarchaeota archaeon]|nr:hypothetical protein [Candidatus Aenigmarchaeota archaeon]